MPFTVYILKCTDDTFHIGITKFLSDRLAYHTAGKNPYTAPLLPVELAYQKAFDTITEALHFEKTIRLKNDPEIAELIAGKIQVAQPSSGEKQSTTKEKSSIVLPSAYLGNLAYLEQISGHDEVRIDITEPFQKQTYRSRCTILSANGLQNLVVPVIRPHGKNTQMQDVKISYAENWQKDHLKALESACRRAPFYEHFVEDLFAILEQKHDFLLDLNTALTQFLIRKFNLTCTLVATDQNARADLPAKILMSPRNRVEYHHTPYHQVLNTGEFEANLSAVDLLFNEGRYLL